MDLFKEFINSYGVAILYTIVTAVFGYIGVVIKNLIQKYINDKTKKSIIKTCVQAVEQLYKDLHGQDKFDMCVDYASQMLENKGILISAIEIQMLIEAAVKEMNDKAKLSEALEDDEVVIKEIEEAGE